MTAILIFWFLGVIFGFFLPRLIIFIKYWSDPQLINSFYIKRIKDGKYYCRETRDLEAPWQYQMTCWTKNKKNAFLRLDDDRWIKDKDGNYKKEYKKIYKFNILMKLILNILKKIIKLKIRLYNIF